MKTSRPMTMTDAALFLRRRAYFRTIREATAFLRDVRDDARMRHPGTGDRPAYSVACTAQRRFIVMEDEPGCTCPSCAANRPERQRLEYLRGELRGERISSGELAELQSLTAHIEPGDTELLEAAGVPEFPEPVEAEQDRVEALVHAAEDSPFLRRPEPVSWDMWAHDRGDRFDNPGEQWWVEIHGLPYPIVPVTVTEVAGDDPNATHWGWIDSRDSSSRLAGVPVMVWASKAAFNAQFPYGALAEVEAGTGQIVRLRITAREIPPG